jgi:tetraacyldisaccharide 4'-kinase
MHEWLTGVWYASARGGWVLTPLGWLFGIVTAVRRRLYRIGVLRSRLASCPVVVIGNVTVGGTGKTPLAIWLADRLGRAGMKVGIASRGYGGGDVDAVREVGPSDAARDVGDEPLLMVRRTRARVAVGRRRTAVVEHLAAHGAEVVICDDGLQHYALARDLEIAVVDGTRRFGNGRLLPAGPLREPVSRLDGIRWVFCTGGRPTDGEIGMQLVGAELHRVGTEEKLPLAGFRGRSCHALAAIGNPERFFTTLREAGVDVVPHPLPDHGDVEAEIDGIPDGETVIMTEKDAVKYQGSRLGETWYLPVDARPGPAADRLVAEIVELCGRHGSDRGPDPGMN